MTPWLAEAPPSPCGLRRGSLRHDGACRAEAGVASEGWWSQAGSNRRPLACHASALPAELWPLRPAPRALGDARGAQNPEHSSGPISSLLVAADVADDVGDVLVALFLIGDEGGIVIVIVFDGLVDLDVVFRLGNDGLDLAGAFLGVGFLERHQLFSLNRLRRCFGGGGGGRGAGAGGGVGPGPRRRNRRNRHDLAGVGRDHRVLVEIVEFLARRRANAFGSEIGFGHGGILEIFEKRSFTWLVGGPLSIALCGRWTAPRDA